MAAADDHATIYKDFGEAVNMAPAELERFLDSDDSKRVGWKGEDGKGSGESVGHKSGLLWCMHKLAYQANRKCYVRPSVGQINQLSH